MEVFYKKYYKRIFDFLYKYCGDEEIALDLLQETFYRFYKRYANTSLSEEQSLMLLFTIAKNYSINYSKKFSTVKENKSYFEVHEAKNVSFEKREELIDMEERLRKCLLLLPEEERTAVILKNIDDMKLSQIAEIMGVSISTASRLVARATAKLIELARQKEIYP
jgi:RNA polymerase sigma factor (sigma-70 family)